MLGLTLAHRLAGPNRNITLIEASDRLGGMADAWSIGEVEWDRHYHVTLLSDQNLRAVLEDIGLADQLQWTTTKTDFYTQGAFSPLNNAIDYLKFPPLGLIDKFRLAGTILYASRINNGLRLEGTLVEDWLTKLSGAKVFDKVWRPLLRAKLGENYKLASASFIWSVIRRLYAARRSGLKTEMFGYVTGGYAHILRQFEHHLKSRDVTCLTNKPVKSVKRLNRELLVTDVMGKSAAYDRVVVTAAAPLAARMCPELTEQETDALNATRYQGIVCASVLLKKPLHGCYITYIADETIPFTAVIEMSAVVDRKAFNDYSLVYLPCYVPSDDSLFECTDAEIQARFLPALKEMYPHIGDDDIAAFKVSRVRQVLAVQTLNYSDRLTPMNTSIPGLHIVNSAHIVNGNLNVDETINLANDAAQMLIDHTPPSDVPAKAGLEQVA